MPPCPSSLLPQHDNHLHDNALDLEFVGNLDLCPPYTYIYNSSHRGRLHYEPASVSGTLQQLSYLDKTQFY